MARRPRRDRPGPPTLPVGLIRCPGAGPCDRARSAPVAASGASRHVGCGTTCG